MTVSVILRKAVSRTREHSAPTASTWRYGWRCDGNAADQTTLGGCSCAWLGPVRRPTRRSGHGPRASRSPTSRLRADFKTGPGLQLVWSMSHGVALGGCPPVAGLFPRKAEATEQFGRRYGVDLLRHFRATAVPGSADRSASTEASARCMPEWWSFTRRM